MTRYALLGSTAGLPGLDIAAQVYGGARGSGKIMTDQFIDQLKTWDDYRLRPTLVICNPELVRILET